MKHALLYDPYLDTLGGGERYTLTIAQILQDLGWQVTLAWPDQEIISQAQDRFGLRLSNVKTNAQFFNLFSKRQNLYTRFIRLKDLDFVFVVSDGSIPILFGKKKFLHYQIPFTQINRQNFLNKIKLLSISKIIVNSRFTKKVIDQTLNTNQSVILYPPVDTDILNPASAKENLILNVGRFASPSHPKRQEVLIEGFKKFYQRSKNKNWRLVLAGGYQDNDDQLNLLREASRNLPIKLVLNPNYTDLINLYRKSKIYWHAAGYEVDEELNPEAVEHFGIVTVEAMAAGCVPVVINKGGQKEIVTAGIGFLWNNLNELVENTQDLCDSPSLLAQMSQSSIKRAIEFNHQHFQDNFVQLLNENN